MMDFFGLVSPRKSEGRIIFGNKAGQTLLVDADADANAIGRMPTFKDDKGRDPILISLAPPPDAHQDDDHDQLQEDDDLLYIMTRTATRHLPGYRSCFDVLKLGGSGESEQWQWQALPSPPFVNDPRYYDHSPATILCHAVVDGGRTICVSFNKGVGTYCFDTAQCAWRHVGDWSLPFESDGCAEYVPHLDLWLGFSRESPHDLCWTSELSGMPTERPPALQGVWPDLVVTPENWSPTMSSLVNLGSGRFCVARFFEIEPRRSTWWDTGGYGGYYYPEIGIEVAVLTGIEICRGEQGPKVLKHKSIFYKFVGDGIRWVLYTVGSVN